MLINSIRSDVIQVVVHILLCCLLQMLASFTHLTYEHQWLPFRLIRFTNVQQFRLLHSAEDIQEGVESSLEVDAEVHDHASTLPRSHDGLEFLPAML